MRHLAVCCYVQQQLFRREPIRQPEFFIELAGSFAEGLKRSGAHPHPSGVDWTLESDVVCVVITDDQVRGLIAAVEDLPVPEEEFEGLFHFVGDLADLERLDVAIREVLVILHHQLDLPVPERPGPELPSTA